MARAPKAVVAGTEGKKSRVKEKPEREEIMVLQLAGKEWNIAELRGQAVAAYVAEGHRASAIKRLELYIKPEDGKAYYVVNGKANGSIDL